MSVSIEVSLDRVGSVYKVGELVKGVVNVISSRGSAVHGGISLVAEGVITMAISPKASGIFDSLLHPAKPLELLKVDISLADTGKFPEGKTPLPFEFRLEPKKGAKLYETYHGVFVNLTYIITVEMKRGRMQNKVKEVIQFNVINPGQSASEKVKPVPIPFKLTADSLKAAKPRDAPSFHIQGQLDAPTWDISKPLTGHVKVVHCDIPLKSMELQLIRVEFISAQDGGGKEATEIQNIQIADGNVCRGLEEGGNGFEIPMYMIFPRWFTCPTLVTNPFRVDFELNLVIVLEDSHQITENFPIKLYRPAE